MSRAFIIVVIIWLTGLSGHSQTIRSIKATELAQYIAQSDHPLLINFWATYCGPCIQEMPYFEKLTEKYKRNKVELLLVSLDLPAYYPDKIVSFTRDKNIRASVWWLNETDADYFCPLIDRQWSGAIPASLFINNQTGYRQFFERSLTEPQLRIELDKLVGNSPAVIVSR